MEMMKLLLLWYLSIFISALTFVYALSQRSGTALIVSAITFLPISIYFAGFNHPIQYIALMPIFMILFGIYVIAHTKRQNFA